MWRSSRGLVVVVMLIVIVVAGTLLGIACAPTGNGDGELPNAPGERGLPGMPESLLARVAEILEIEQQELEDAFAQAQSEMPDVGPWQGPPEKSPTNS